MSSGMRFEAFIYESVFLPYTVPLSGVTMQAAVDECVEIYKSKHLITPVMVIDHEEKKAWRIGKSESGWYLSDTAREKYGMGTDAEDIATMEASCES